MVLIFFVHRQGFLEDLRLIRDNCHTFCRNTHPNLPPVADKLLAESERGIEFSKVVCIVTLCSKYARAGQVEPGERGIEFS